MVNVSVEQIRQQFLTTADRLLSNGGVTVVGTGKGGERVNFTILVGGASLGASRDREDVDPVVLQRAIEGVVKDTDEELQVFARRRKQGESVKDLKRLLGQDHLEGLGRREGPFGIGADGTLNLGKFYRDRYRRAYPGRDEAWIERTAQAAARRHGEEVA